MEGASREGIEGSKVFILVTVLSVFIVLGPVIFLRTFIPYWSLIVRDSELPLAQRGTTESLEVAVVVTIETSKNPFRLFAGRGRWSEKGTKQRNFTFSGSV